MKETFVQAAERHEALATSVMAEAERIKASAPAGAEGRAMRDQAWALRSRVPALRRAAEALTTVAAARAWQGVSLATNPVMFEDCDFRGVMFERCDLRQVTFERCDLRGAQMVACNVAGLRLVDCNIDGLWFGDEEEQYARQYARPSRASYCWNGGIGSDTRGVIHSGCTGTAIGLDYVEDKWNSGLGATSAAYRASRND